MSEIPDTIHPSTAQYELTDNPNNWQLIARTTKGIVTPANAIDTVAIAGAKYGIDHLDSTKGRLITALSFTTDFFDGRIARATGTQSPLGEAVDAGGDKLKLAYGAVKLWRAGLVDKPLLTAVVAQNTANAGLTLADRKLNQKPAIHPTKIGKLSFFAQELGIGINTAGHFINDKKPRTGNTLRLMGNIIGFTGFAMGTVATKGYFDTLCASRTDTKGPIDIVY